MRILAHGYANTHTHVNAYIHTCAFTHACTRVCTYKSTYKSLCMYTSLTSHTHTHTRAHTHILSHFNIYRWRLNIRQHVWFLVGRPWAFVFFCLAEDVFKSWKNASDSSNRRKMNLTTGVAGPAGPVGPVSLWSFGQRSSA